MDAERIGHALQRLKDSWAVYEVREVSSSSSVDALCKALETAAALLAGSDDHTRRAEAVGALTTILSSSACFAVSSAGTREALN